MSEDKKYMTITQAAEALGITRQRVHQLLKAKRIRGAQQVGKFWIIPEDAEIIPSTNKGGRPRKQ